MLAADAVWAVNVGGPAYEASDGTRFASEESVAGGEISTLDSVLGTQDTFLYQSYRVGEISIDRPVESGTYVLTFHFAEPLDIAQGERLFDVIVEGRTVIDGLDVMLSRDGKPSRHLRSRCQGLR